MTSVTGLISASALVPKMTGDPDRSGGASAAPSSSSSPGHPVWAKVDLGLLLSRSGTQLLHAILREEEEEEEGEEEAVVSPPPPPAPLRLLPPRASLSAVHGMRECAYGSVSRPANTGTTRATPTDGHATSGY